MDFCRTGKSPLSEGNIKQAEKLINNTPVSGKEMVNNLEKNAPADSTNNKPYQKALIIAKQKRQSESEDSKK